MVNKLKLEEVVKIVERIIIDKWKYKHERNPVYDTNMGGERELSNYLEETTYNAILGNFTITIGEYYRDYLHRSEFNGYKYQIEVEHKKSGCIAYYHSGENKKIKKRYSTIPGVIFKKTHEKYQKKLKEDEKRKEKQLDDEIKNLLK